MNRRRFLKCALGSTLAAPILATCYGRLEARWLHVVRQTIFVPNLPPSFEGMKLALVADLHHGPWVPLDFIRAAVEEVNALSPDLIAMPGDFVKVHRHHIWMRPCIEAISHLRAPLGVFATPGNHDHWDQIDRFHRSLSDFGIRDATNSGQWVERGPYRLRVCGIDDLWEGKPNLSAALGDSCEDDCSLLLCHNPDFVERIRDRRVSLALSGHTHGGQVWLAGYYRHVPSRYGKKYLAGLVQTPWTQVYVTRGLGLSGPPLRVACRPEVNLLTLTAAG